MSSIAIGRLQELHSEVAARLAEAEASAWRATDAELLELCRRRLAQMFGNESADNRHGVRDDAAIPVLAAWWTSPLYTDTEKAHLAFAEQFAMSVSSMTDNDVATLLEFRGPHEVYDFVSALYLIDMVERLVRVTGVVL